MRCGRLPSTATRSQSDQFKTGLAELRTEMARAVESDQVALGRLDAVIAGILFMAGMRRSEVSALRWADVADAADGDGILVTVRRGKTNQEGEVRAR